MACCGGVFDWGAAEKRLAELTALSESPEFWNDPQKAQTMMRERNRIVSAMDDIRALEGEARDAVDLWELAEGVYRLQATLHFEPVPNAPAGHWCGELTLPAVRFEVTAAMLARSG